MHISSVFERWSWLAGILGAVITLISLIWQIYAASRKKSRKGDWEVMVSVFHGLRVGAPVASLQRISLTPVSREGNGSIKMTKFRLDNGNDLSVTYDSVQDRILYVEVDWNHAPSGKGTGISKLKFGETSLKDIRKRYRSNGFTHLKHASCRDDGELVMFNAFELKRTPTIILAFATRLPHESESLIKTLSPEKQVELISNYLMLESIVVADESYLDEIWGEDKSYDPLSKGIRL